MRLTIRSFVNIAVKHHYYQAIHFDGYLHWIRSYETTNISCTYVV